jgi:hypothetical protein
MYSKIYNASIGYYPYPEGNSLVDFAVQALDRGFYHG